MGRLAWDIPIALGGVAALLVASYRYVWTPYCLARQNALFLRAMHDFHRQREWLEAKFLELASSSGKPRGLAWVDCNFDDDVVYARDRRSGELAAFVGVTVRFEAVVGGGMEHVEAVANLRAATAVFRTRGGQWNAEGRALFNLRPAEAVEYFQEDLELVGCRVGGGRAAI